MPILNEAIEQMRSGRWPKAMWKFMKIGSGSQSYGEAVKWLSCALVEPFAPKDKFYAVITAPARQSILKILRYHFGGASAAIKKTIQVSGARTLEQISSILESFELLRRHKKEHKRAVRDFPRSGRG